MIPEPKPNRLRQVEALEEIARQLRAANLLASVTHWHRCGIFDDATASQLLEFLQLMHPEHSTTQGDT